MCSLLCSIVLAMSMSTSDAAANAYDAVWIRGGTVIDGTGAPGRLADVLIRGNRIVAVGALGEPQPSEKVTVIDATGKVVTPGFIDTHAHGDPRKTPTFENFLAMGVTTICLGQDGESPTDLAAWMGEVDAADLGPNVAIFVGHGTVRDLAGVGLRPDPSPDELSAMQRLVGDAMAAGCFGLTTGLEYQPGSFAGAAELAALAMPVADAGGLVMSHMRSEDDDAIERALAELLEQGRAAGCPVHVSHIKVTYGHGAERADRVLAQLQAARLAGQRVTADIYPYLASYTGIGIVFPDWAKPPHDYEQVKRERREELADYLRRRVTQRNGPEATLLGTDPWAGKTLAEVATELGKPFEDVLIDDIGPGGASGAYFVMDEALQARLLADPHMMICSDGRPSMRHPRGYGSFAKIVCQFVRTSKLFSLEEGVRKMTSLAADTVGLTQLGYGRLVAGAAADVLVFDPAVVRDVATFTEPHQLAEGFDWVIVGGRLVRANGVFTAERPGQLLRKPTTQSALPLPAGVLTRRVQTLAKAEGLVGAAPGVSVAVYHQGNPAFTFHAGLADLASHTPTGDHTNYRMASVTKQFTAMAVMILAERKQLSYDDPIRKHLPELPQAYGDVTIRDLLTHVSGLPDYEDLMAADTTEQLKDRDVLNLLIAHPQRLFPRGTQYRYSNTGYALLALIVEEVSGQSFAAFLREHIFLPLKMNDTVAYEKGISTVPSRAFGYQASEGDFVDADQSPTSAILGDGGVYTSVADFSRWNAALSGTTLVTAETLREAFTSGVLADGSSTGYGFGWRLSRRRGVDVVHHDGRTCGFNTAVRRAPDRSFTVVVFANRPGNHAARIADTVLDDLLVAGVDSTLPGFEVSPHFGEQIKRFTCEEDILVHINAPAAEAFDPRRPTTLVLFALPNGNTTAQTIGRRMTEGLDWHYDIQHIGAQIRRLREVVNDRNFVVAYLEAESRSWPTWRRKHEDSGPRIERMLDAVRAPLVGFEPTVAFASHSGGGALIFEWIEKTETLPAWLERVVFLDANYAYDMETHTAKLATWLSGSPDHRLNVIAYDDREVELDGKRIVGPTGGTYRRTQQMCDDFGKAFALVEHRSSGDVRLRTADGQVEFVLLNNPDKAILHTVLVEKNGLLHALTVGTKWEAKAGAFFAGRAYEEWIQPN